MNRNTWTYGKTGTATPICAANSVAVLALPKRSGGDSHGFTLIELVLVVGIIAVIMGLALPRIMPTIVYSEFELEARKLSGFGRAAAARCTLMQERLTIHIDLADQEYWAMTVPDTSEAFFAHDDDEEELLPEDEMDPLELSMAVSSMYEGTSEYDEEQVEKNIEKQQKDFQKVAIRNILDRTKVIKHDAGFLDEIGDLFEDDFTLDDYEPPEPEEVTEYLIERTRLPEGIEIDSVETDGRSKSSGEVEIEVGPLGFAEPVVFYIKNEDREYFTIVWEAVSGNARVYDGKETNL